jgi:hypothetical protein
MFSSTLALFNRAFRVDARSMRPHVLRLLFAGVILLQLVATQEMESLYGAPGLTFFQWITWLNFGVITLAGIGYFATAISEEKEEDSLGLLKMAGISPVALLLGKSTTRLIAVLLLLAVEFPFVLLSITLGGVLMSQVIAMAVALAAYLVFIANLGLICSVVCRNSRQAATLMTVTLAVFLVVLPVLQELAAFWTMTGVSGGATVQVLTFCIQWERSISMWNRISTITSTGFAESPVSRQVVSHLAASALLFGLSWAGFERFTREKHGLRPLERVFGRTSRGVRRNRCGRPWSLALTWKDFNFVVGGRRMLIVRFLLYFSIIGGLLALFSWDTPAHLTAKEVGGVAMWSMMVAAAIELGLIASRVFREEVKAHTLPLLMMLPESTAKLCWSKAATAIPFLLPSVFYFCIGAVLDWDDFSTACHDICTSWMGWYVFIWFVLFLHLAAYLSLLVKWGALPLAIFLIYVSQMILFPLFFALSWFLFRTEMSNEGTGMLLLMGIGVAGIIDLEYRIPRRLRLLAGR